MEYIKKTIEELKKVVAEKEAEMLEKKKMANDLCKMANLPPVYVIQEQTETTSVEQLRGDEYYGKALATVITLILESRKILGMGPATVREIFDQMKAGGYLFETKNDANSQRGIRISMRKNPKFHRLPTGKWGLLSWYPNIKESKKTDSNQTTPEEDEAQSTQEEGPQNIQEKPKRKRGRPRKSEQIKDKQNESEK